MNGDIGLLIEEQPDSATLGQRPSMLVIGYGNPLRGDDAAGYYVAQQVASWELEHVSVLAVHQLTPELAATLSQYDEALFIDATHEQNASLRLIGPHLSEGASTHVCDPQGLLALADALYGRYPVAWWLTIPTVQYELGAPLSAIAANGVEDAFQIMRSLLHITKRYSDA